MKIKNIINDENYIFNKNVKDIYKTEIYKSNLYKFIEYGILVLSKKKTIDDINNTDEAGFRFYPPKIKSNPILTGVLDYYFILTEPSANNLGTYFGFHGFISRDSKDGDWNRFGISGYYNDFDKESEFGCFNENDFENLKIKLKSKEIISDDDSKYKAIYNFETIRNGILLELIFTVSKEQYLENVIREDFPYKWSKLIIKRIK